MRQGQVFVDNQMAGVITETDEGNYRFQYDSGYLNTKTASPVSLTLPLQEKAYESSVLFPFFDGLIPEGWLLDISISNWKLQANDRMGLLLATCQDCIGNVSIRKVDENA